MTSKDKLESVPKLIDTATYPLWESEIRILLEGKQLMSLIDGTGTLEQCRVEEKKKREWITKDTNAKVTILRTIDPTVKSHVLTSKMAKDMFEKLSNVYKRAKEETKSQLILEFIKYEYNKLVDVMTNIAALQTLAFRMNNLKHTVDDVMLMTKILTILPDQFKHFGSAWDTTAEDKKTLQNLRARLLKKEEKLKNNSQSQDDKVAFKAFKFKGICNHCGKQGHCKFERRSNPENNKQQRQYKDIQKNEQTFKHCKKCDKDGRWTWMDVEECWQGKTFPICKFCKKVNHPQDKCRWKYEHENRYRESQKDNSRKVAYLIYLTENERTCAKLRSEPDYSFVADTGATGHFVKDEYILTDSKEIEEIKIGVAKKGQNLTSNLSGKVESKEVTLTNVDETEEYLKEYIHEAEAHFNLKTERIRCDNGGEFRSNEFKLWCKQRGIVIEYTIRDTPQQNGKADCMNLTLMNKRE
ncbi:hypothetical protein J437_LFUL005904 [Ladona fulva]|uniref:Integrase catalytic domain-containing protein n=1 Tax=Ladona fulva TaxID=123851 RepID=A0A8K0P0J6_LADFU|nr:hypothetical protein J437_LFUL005904 [Ladona fulva]